MSKVIGVDIGGMTVKIGLCEDGKILDKRVLETELNPEVFADDVANLIKTILKDNNLTEKDILGVGIGSPGSITSETGTVEYSGNLEWEKVPICDLLKKRLSTNYKITNDANAAALGEAKFGVAKGYKNVIMLTLGTGVGGGIIIDGKLYEGNESKGGEVGHTLLIMNGKQCTCGRKGCIEAYVSATALIRDTKEEMLKNKNSSMWKAVNGDIEKVVGKTAFDEEKNGDESAKKVVENYIACLSEAVMDFCNIFRPEVLVLGGGISNQGEALTSRIEKYIEPRAYGFRGTPRVKILTATLKNDAGILGAAALLL